MITTLLLLLLQANAAPGHLWGLITTQQGQIRLPGVTISLHRSSSEEPLLQTISGNDGHFVISNLPPGTYRLTASLPGFEELVREIDLLAGQTLELELELTVAGLQQTVEVTARQDQVTNTGTSQENLAGELINLAPVRGDDFRALLPLLPGVVRATDGRLIMKGGQPTQSSLVVNSSNNVTDPATGDLGYNLPVDAIEELNVLPNPYSAEYGRFSSGITNILTRQGTNRWQFLVNNFLPKPKIRDGTIMGIGGFKPRVSIRGPLRKDRLFLAQTLQYRFLKTKIPSTTLPALSRDTRLESFASFTQLDGYFNQKHSLSGIFSVFPQRLTYANLDAFNPQAVTANMHQRGYNIGVSERWVPSASKVLESTLSFKRFDVDIFGQGFEEMVLAPDQNSGNFFNLQRRRTKTWQWVEQFSFLKEGWQGQHLFKVGADLLHSSLEGTSKSQPVNVERADGSLSQRITFLEGGTQNADNTDLALFLQDRWRFNDRFLVELGLRLDRDGVLRRNNLAPRFGFVFSLQPDRTLLRGGIGLFYDRTPLNVAVFEDYERPVVNRFDSRGELAQQTVWSLQRADRMKTPYSVTWNLEVDHNLGERLLVKANYLRRQGYQEFIMDPLPEPIPVLRLNSRGRSRYWELELTTRYDHSENTYWLASYVHSRSEQDLNAFDRFFGNFRDPIIRGNEFSLADTDVPHRFVLQGSTLLPGNWIFSPVVEIRSGFPYGTIDENRDFVSARNRAGRFRTVFTLDIDIQKGFKIGRFKTRIGVRLFNFLNRFNPRDVQNNIDSEQFGTFYNQLRRVIGGTLQIEP